MNLFKPLQLEPKDDKTTFKEKSFNHVVSQIESGNYIHNPFSFHRSLAKSEHPDMMTSYSISELSQMKLFKVAHYNIGFALKLNAGEHCEIVAVHNNEPPIKGIGKILLQSAIRNGGKKLDHFGSQKLTDLYESLGFQEVRRVAYDPIYDPTGIFKEKYGELPIIYREITS